MKTTPIAQVKPTMGTIQQPNSAESSRARAIALLEGSAPVQNQSNVAPEEMSAVVPKVQNDSVVESEKTASTEAPLEEVKDKPAEPSLSSQYAQLGRKEKALRAQVRDLRAREDALKAKEEALRTKESAPQPAIDESKYIPKEKITQDLLGTLSELGFTYDQITQAVLDQGQGPDPATKALINQLQTEINQLKGETEGTKKAMENQQQQSYQQALNEIRSETKRLVTLDPAFETIKETNSINDVVELIEETFKEDGVLLTVEEAAQEVEDYLVEKLSAYATKINKIKQRLQPKPVAPKPTEQVQRAQPPQQSKTLTNSMATSRKLNARERAILAFKGEKQN